MLKREASRWGAKHDSCYTPLLAGGVCIWVAVSPKLNVAKSDTARLENENDEVMREEGEVDEVA